MLFQLLQTWKWSDCLLFFLLHWLHLLYFSARCILVTWCATVDLVKRGYVCVSIYTRTITLVFFVVSIHFILQYIIPFILNLFGNCQFFLIGCTYFGEVSFSIKKDLIFIDFHHLIGLSLAFLITWFVSVLDAVTAQLFATNRHLIYQLLWVFMSLWAEKSATYVTVKMPLEELLAPWCSTSRRLYPCYFASNCSYRTKSFLNLTCFSCCFPFLRKLALIFNWR